MADLKHLFPKNTATTEQYTYGPRLPAIEFKLPSRDDRVGHGRQLIRQIKSAERESEEQAEKAPKATRAKGFTLEFCSDPGFKLKLESLDIRGSGIELLNSRVDKNGVMHATVFVPEGKAGIFVRRFEAYTKEDTKKGKPKNKPLVESITEVRLAVLERSFWTDAREFPSEKDKPFWWEVWLREGANPHHVADDFRERARSAGMEVGPREIRFPERRVLLAKATVAQWTTFENLFDILAELRFAKTLASEFLELPPRDQVGLVDEAISRIQPPPEDAPAVCHLDTGVNRGHPLLEFAIREEHVLTVDPSWSPADRDGHGTEMAGIALYGCLTSVLESSAPIVLRHRLESVKMYRKDRRHDPDLFGDITSQAVSRAEIVAPERGQRVFCLTVTTDDGRDEGFPSSWSGAIDQICAGVDEEGEPVAPKRLLFVSAGNTPWDGREEYPRHNHDHGVQDPAQSWNAISVGAYTEKAVIRSNDYDGWQPIAPPGRLSPASSTSRIWQDKSWPLKPDIVMEGGNNALDPSTGRADNVDDLRLLTTQLSPGRSLFTTTGDTSAAAAQAARHAAIIWAHYPDLWPETVRGLLIHSARWTDQMVAEFPRQRENRLRCYGYGVPDLQKALRSVSNAATLIIEGTLKPYDKDGSTIKTRDMHLHRLPWPTQVLEDLGEVNVQMRVTLSYFIEPSPGGRGWERKFRYQSHGLRFDVRRPEERDDHFHKRISKAAREEDEKVRPGEDDREWEIGPRLRSKGSVHSDTWTGGTAVQLARCGVLAVFPVRGWWRERKHLGCWNRQARYALIVTIETPETDVYTPIANQIGVTVESVTET